MSDQRLRRWAIIKSALGQRLVFADQYYNHQEHRNNAGSMSQQTRHINFDLNRRRWPNNKSTLGQRPMFTGVRR